MNEGKEIPGEDLSLVGGEGGNIGTSPADLIFHPLQWDNMVRGGWIGYFPSSRLVKL